jgi:predicted branched-subunit amino acid permease
MSAITLRAPAVRPAVTAGVRDMSPLLVGLAPFGLAVGVTIARSPLDRAVGWATGPVLFSGASQLTAIDLLGSGASALTMIASLALLNARFAFYGAALAPRFRNQPRWFRVLGPYFLVDPLVATVSGPGTPVDDASWRDHYLGAALVLWATWIGSVTVGVICGPLVDPAWGLDFAAPLCLVALVSRRVTTRSAVAATGAGAAAASLALVAPPGLAVLTAMVAGSTAAMLADRSPR